MKHYSSTGRVFKFRDTLFNYRWSIQFLNTPFNYEYTIQLWIEYSLYEHTIQLWIEYVQLMNILFNYGLSIY